jgi:phage terminase small subunit
MRPLTYRQRLFVAFYLGKSKGCALDAARRAGYASPHPEGARLLKRPAIRAAIDAHVDTAAMTAEEVLARLADAASTNVLDFIDLASDGCKVDLKRIRRRGLGHLIKRVRIRKDGTTEIDLESRLYALVKLGEYHSLWKGVAEEQITMVDAAKELQARYERLRKARECGNNAGGLPGPTGPVQ